MKPILEIRNLSKKYRISHEKHAYLSLRDSISGLFKGIGTSKEDFYALKDVSFDVMPGETLGIIGKNGAGKSTLLKIISRITPPSSGTIIGRGRIASLLEVGTGFHPELSGRENIYFNGSILGMKRKEINRNLDAIIDFSGVEKFIDTPLKHYSSGMQLRLAFAVAAFLENEILIIDEVLAVGDAEFQKKCLGKMDEVSKSGRTVLFVSHQLSSLQTLCEKGLVFEKGSLVFSSNSSECIDYYLANKVNHLNYQTTKKNKVDKDFYVSSILIKPSDTATDKINFTDSINITVTIHTNNYLENVYFGFSINSAQNNRLLADYRKLERKNFSNDQVKIEITLPGNLLFPRSYFLSTGIISPDGSHYEILEDVCSFRVEDSEGKLVQAPGIDYGSVLTPLNWRFA